MKNFGIKVRKIYKTVIKKKNKAINTHLIHILSTFIHIYIRTNSHQIVNIATTKHIKTSLYTWRSSNPPRTSAKRPLQLVPPRDGWTDPGSCWRRSSLCWTAARSPECEVLWNCCLILKSVKNLLVLSFLLNIRWYLIKH